MKTISAQLLANVGNSYDQTRTTTQGRVSQKTIEGIQVLGPRRNKFVDVFTDSGQTPGLVYLSPAGRLFVTAASPTNGGTFDTLPILCYDIDYSSGFTTYVGRIDISLPNLAATVHTLRSLKVYNDVGNTGWRIALATTATVTINGGLFVVNNIDKADFLPIAHPTIPMATGNNQKAVYFLQDPAAIGAQQLNIATVGSVLDRSTGRIYVHNGTAATHQYFIHDLSTANLNMELRSVSVSAASPAVVTDTGHTFNNNDPVIFTAGTLPTGLSLNTVYFVRNPVAGVSYNLSTTSGGGNINTTGVAGSATITRAWGTTSSGWVHKTGNLPALAGTLLANDSEDFANPGHTTNAGFDCAFLATSINLYMGRLSELTSGATTWPSLVTANQLGAPGEIVNSSALVASWSNSLDRAVFSLSPSRYVLKRVVSNEITSRFGTANVSILEATSVDPIDFGCLTSTNADFESGWLAINSTTTGQRGVLLKDVRADDLYDESFIVTKVLDVDLQQVRSLNLLKVYNDSTVGVKLYYRTSGFGTVSGGWVSVESTKEISLPLAAQIQFKITFNVNGKQSTIPQQVSDLLVNVESLFEISDNWEFSDDFSDNQVPSRTAFRLKKAYQASVPQLFYRAYDLSNTLLVTHNTVTQAANFEYSTDNGTTWLPLGTIPNVVGTLLRYTFTSPPGVDIRPSIKES